MAEKFSNNYSIKEYNEAIFSRVLVGYEVVVTDVALCASWK